MSPDIRRRLDSQLRRRESAMGRTATTRPNPQGGAMETKMDRRSFIKVTGASAVAATSAIGGLAGILESGRAPAYAQGTKLHILRWNDFIPRPTSS